MVAGLVVAVSGRQIVTIEYNTSDMVARRNYTVGQSSIYGYGRPDWSLGGDDEATEPATAPTSPTDDSMITRLAQEVIAGRWGTGADRVARLTTAGYDYTIVQARVNEILSGKTAAPAPADEELVSETDTQGATYTLELQELAQGAQSTAVRRVQAMLIDLGYKCGGKVRNGHETPDGDFGPTTLAAVKAYQKANALTVTGKVDRATMKALLK